jgi:quercetin dioxygenase-like cupin family protein
MKKKRTGLVAVAAVLAALAVAGCVTTPEPFFASPDDGRKAKGGHNSDLRLIAKDEEVAGYFDVVDHRWPPGSKGDMHVHAFDTFYFVLEGTVTVDYGDYQRTGGPGSLFFNPKGVPHAHIDSGGKGMRMLLLYVGGFGDGMDVMLDAVAQVDPKDPEYGAKISAIVKNIGKTWPVQASQ